MRARDLLKKYSYFSESLVKLGQYALDEEITLDNAGLRKNVIVTAYRIKEKFGFNGSALDFLYVISLQFVLCSWNSDTNAILARKTYPRAILDTDEDRLKFYLTELIETCFRHKTDAKNMLRIIFRNPRYFFESEFFCEFISKFAMYNETELRFVCFKVISVVYFSLCFDQNDTDIACLVNNEMKNLSF